MAVIEKVCGYCAYMDVDIVKRGKFRCEHNDDWHFADDDVAEVCRKFCPIFWSKLDKARSAVAESKSYKRACGCYIATAVSKMLGLDEDNYELNKLKEFRLNIMTNESPYKADIMRYDIIGPILAKKLIESNNISLACDIYNIYIKGAVSYIKKGEYDKAVELYFHDLMNTLSNTFIDFSPVIPDEMINHYDTEAGGNNCFTTKTI